MDTPATLAPAPADSGADYAISGRLDIHGAAKVWPRLRQLPSGTRIDGGDITACDGAGAALLFDLIRRGIVIDRLDPAFRRLIDALEPATPLAGGRSRQEPSLIHRLGHMTSDWLAELGEQITFAGAAFAALLGLVRRPQTLRRQDFLHQCEQVGADALPIIALISFLIGVILAYQSALPLRQFGAEVYVANLLGLSLVREMGPLITAILMSGRTGAAFAAELGTMKVNEEINALVTFGFDPVRFLVLPRLLAGTLMAPLLTACAEIVGMLAGALMLAGFGIPLSTFAHQVIQSTDLSDFIGGMVKAAIFGFEVAAIGCLRGLSTGAGASAVGSSTTRAVVQTLVVLVITDGILAIFYYHAGI